MNPKSTLCLMALAFYCASAVGSCPLVGRTTRAAAQRLSTVPAARRFTTQQPTTIRVLPSARAMSTSSQNTPKSQHLIELEKISARIAKQQREIDILMENIKKDLTRTSQEWVKSTQDKIRKGSE